MSEGTVAGRFRGARYLLIEINGVVRGSLSRGQATSLITEVTGAEVEVCVQEERGHALWGQLGDLRVLCNWRREGEDRRAVDGMDVAHWCPSPPDSSIRRPHQQTRSRTVTDVAMRYSCIRRTRSVCTWTTERGNGPPKLESLCNGCIHRLKRLSNSPDDLYLLNLA